MYYLYEKPAKILSLSHLAHILIFDSHRPSVVVNSSFVSWRCITTHSTIKITHTIKTTLMKSLAVAAVAGLMAVASNSQAALIPGACQDIKDLPSGANNPTGEFAWMSSIYPGKLNGSFRKYNPGSNVVDDFGDLEAPLGDTLTVAGVVINGAKLSFDDQEPFYYLVKASTERCAYYYDGVGAVVDFLNPIVNKGKPRDYSHVTFFGMTFFGIKGDGDIPTVPEGGTSVALLGLALTGLGAARRFMGKKA